MKKLSVPMSRLETILGLVYIVIQLIVLPTVLVLIDILFSLSLSEAELNFLCFVINFVTVIAIFHRFLLASAKNSLSTPPKTLKDCLLGFVFYFIGSFLVSLLILSLEPDFSNANDNSIAGMLEQNYVLMFVGAVILAPVVEEILYRGVVFGQLYRRWPIAAYVISSVVFASLHVVGYIGSYTPLRLILCFVQYLPASLVLAWTYVQADSIWPPILVHIFINTLGMLSM